MRDMPYAAWFAFIERAGIPPGIVLDLFSGTGGIAKIARARGFKTIGLDVNRAMLKQSLGVRLQACAQELPFARGIASACIAANCSINYLLSYHALCVFLAECRRVLVEGGLLALDFCPVERAWALHNRYFKAAGLAVFFHSYNPQKALLESRVAVGALPQPVMEIHSQRIFAHDEIAQSLTAAGFAEPVFTPNYGLGIPTGVAPIITLTARAT